MTELYETTVLSCRAVKHFLSSPYPLTNFIIFSMLLFSPGSEKWEHPKSGGKEWQATPKNLPRMQRTRAIPVAWLNSGLCPDRPKGWIPIIIIIICYITSTEGSAVSHGLAGDSITLSILCAVNWLITQYVIKLTAHISINNYLLFCDAPPTCFSPYRPFLGQTFTKEYICNTCCKQMYTYAVTIQCYQLNYC